MTLIIIKQDGTRYNLRELGIRVIDFEPESLEVVNAVQEIEGGGYVVTNSGYGVRRLHATLQIKGYDMTDYALFRAEVFALFVGLESFYVIDEKVASRRWHVKPDGKFSISRKNTNGTFDITWLCVNKYAESIATTSSFKEWDADVWSWDGTIDWDEDLQYVFNTNQFVVNNLGNAPIDPCENELEIVIKATAASYLQIVNSTTGETYRFNGTLSTNDTLTIRGIQTFKNGVSSFKFTNHALISLKDGLNNFVITGGTIHSIAFNFRFLYK
ncbi:phage tail domain-containing protein [Solibacillus sp. FSL R7-0668]|uniref:phage tail domain-containing protein n=1 Tax=Solibacillus sp. FSL R7-0668 TaxID=2921688 RepID=UPI0030F58292